VTEVEIKTIAKDAAREAVQEFLLVLGVDVTTAPAKLELQQDFAHLRKERLAIGRVRDKIYATIAGSAVTFVIGAVGYYVTHGH
jgi:hypothetical protein